MSARLTAEQLISGCYRVNGGAGSGNFGHAGRPGEVGGSSGEGGASAAPAKEDPWKASAERTKAIGEWAQKTGITGAAVQSAISHQMQKGKSLDDAVKAVQAGGKHKLSFKGVKDDTPPSTNYAGVHGDRAKDQDKRADTLSHSKIEQQEAAQLHTKAAESLKSTISTYEKFPNSSSARSADLPALRKEAAYHEAKASHYASRVQSSPPPKEYPNATLTDSQFQSGMKKLFG